jgi:hypothetical protein
MEVNTENGFPGIRPRKHTYQRFGGCWCLHLEGINVDRHGCIRVPAVSIFRVERYWYQLFGGTCSFAFFTLMTETACSLENMVNTYQFIRCHYAEDHYMKPQRGVNLKVSHTIKISFWNVTYTLVFGRGSKDQRVTRADSSELSSTPTKSADNNCFLSMYPWRGIPDSIFWFQIHSCNWNKCM